MGRFQAREVLARTGVEGSLVKQLLAVVAVAVVAVVLAMPTSAAAYGSYPASASQRARIEASARRTHPCGYDGQFRQLSDFRVAAFGSTHFMVNFASVFWSPSQEDQCQIVFVNQPGYTLRSIATTNHPFLSWVALTWGSSPFDEPGYLDRYWDQWFPNELAPNWRSVARDLLH